MPRRSRFLLIATLTGLGLGAAGLAREMGVGNSLRLAFGTQPRTVNGYSYEEPIGGSDVAPTIFVFSDDRLRYSRVGYRDKSANFRLRATFECMGNWSHEGKGNPEIRVGRSTSYRSADRGGGGKPIYAEGAPFYVIASVPQDDLQAPANLNPVHRCNAVVEDYTRQGKPPGALLSNGFWIKVENAVPASITPACQLTERKRRTVFGEPPKFPTGWQGQLPVYVRCMPTGYVVTKGPPPREGRPASESRAATLDLRATNSPLSHSCPATVIFQGKIHAHRFLKGTYRLVGSGNYASPSYPFDLAAGAERSIAWQRRVDLPDLHQSARWPRRASGWLQLEINAIEPNAQPQRSARALYDVSCLRA